MFSSIIDAVEYIVEDDLNSEQSAEANILIQSLQTFDFAFNFHLMKMFWGLQMSYLKHYNEKIKIF